MRGKKTRKTTNQDKITGACIHFECFIQLRKDGDETFLLYALLFTEKNEKKIFYRKIDQKFNC